MASIKAGRLSEAAVEELADVVVVFYQYRRHYGQPVVPGQTRAWLEDQWPRQLVVFTACMGEDLVGLATAVVLPASLLLGYSWQLRDLYVVPGARRRGAGRALLDAVCQAAAAAGAVRVSVQTEPGNTAALQLYRTSGFTMVEDLQVLTRPL